MIERFELPEEENSHRFLEELTGLVSVVEEPSTRRRCSYFDTFDCLLGRAGYVLSKTRQGWHLIEQKTGKPVARHPLFRAESCLFAWSFPDEAFAGRLGKLIKVRMLIPVAGMSQVSTRYRCLNEDEKTVVRLVVLQESSTRDSVRRTERSLVELQPMRGYDKEASQVSRRLHEAGCVEEAGSNYHELSLFVTRQGQAAFDYASLKKPQLSKEHTVLSAFIEKLGYAHAVVSANVQGMRVGKDSEFLHDYRVAIRQVRSVVTQIKGLLKPVYALSLKQDLGYLAKSTNRMRDLDVYFLGHDHFKSLLPEVLHEGLQQFHQHLGRLRLKELKKLARWLESPRFHMILERWGKAVENLETRSELHGDLASNPVQPVVGKLILRRYRKILKAGSQIDARSPDQELHDLRLQCKKMRYLIEFSQGLFDEKEIRYFIKQFRRLQNTLGRFNDESVYMETLRQYLTEAKTQQLNGEFSAAMGGLITALHAQHRTTRAEFDSGFARIRKSSTVKRARALFKSAS